MLLTLLPHVDEYVGGVRLSVWALLLLLLVRPRVLQKGEEGDDRSNIITVRALETLPTLRRLQHERRASLGRVLMLMHQLAGLNRLDKLPHAIGGHNHKEVAVAAILGGGRADRMEHLWVGDNAHALALAIP